MIAIRYYTKPCCFCYIAVPEKSQLLELSKFFNGQREFYISYKGYRIGIRFDHIGIIAGLVAKVKLSFDPFWKFCEPDPRYYRVYPPSFFAPEPSKNRGIREKSSYMVEVGGIV